MSRRKKKLISSGSVFGNIIADLIRDRIIALQLYAMSENAVATLKLSISWVFALQIKKTEEGERGATPSSQTEKCKIMFAL